MRTFQEFEGLCETMVRGIGDSFENPNDDWVPVALIEAENGIGVVGFSDLTNKEQVASIILPALLQQTKANRVGLVMSAWMSTAEAGKSKEEVVAMSQLIPPSQDPDRKEVLIIACFAADGDESITLFEIERDPLGPPTLRKKEGKHTGIEGRWRDGARKGFGI